MASELDALLGQLAAVPERRAPKVPQLARFDVVRRLNRGSFGDVYEARDRQHGTMVALKALRQDDPESIYRFKNEFRAVANVSHPNLVRLFELLSEQERWFLTMELVEGRRFDEYLRRVPEHTLAAFAQLGAAIDALHRAGPLHRDIKPSNVLVEESGRVVVLDFGMAWDALGRGSTMSGGTPLYMAPEQSLGEPVEASDWYAVGVMLYETIAGKPPWADNVVAMARRKLHEQVPPIERPEGPAAHLAELAVRMLAADPDHRPPPDEILAAFRGTGRVAEPRADATLVGREPELAALEAVLDRSRHETQMMFVEGPPGIGKSMMARELCRRAAARGVLVFDGGCHEGESVPFKGLDAAIDSLCNHLVHGEPDYARQVVPEHAGALSLMFPVLRRLKLFSEALEPLRGAQSPHEVRRRATDTLGEMLSRVAASVPLIIFLDDLQWAGEDTFSLLTTMFARRAPRALFLATIRSRATETSGALDAFVTNTSALDTVAVGFLSLAPLDRDAVATLVARAARPGMSAETAWAHSGGHPYLLVRMLGHAEESWPGGGLEEHLRHSVLTLSAPARRLLEIIALSAMPLPQSAGCVAAGLEGWQPETVEELRAHGLIRTGVHAESLMEAYHDRVRETVASSLSPERYRAAHGELAEFLESRRSPPSHVLATHYREAGRRDHARTWTLKAARDAARGLAFERAARQYAAAVDMSDGDETLALHLEWAEAMALAGHRAESGRICLAAAALAQRQQSVGWSSRLRAAAGEHLMISGRLADGMALIVEALAAVELVLPDDPYVAVAESFNIGARLAVRGLEFAPRDETEIDPQLVRKIDLLLATAQAISQLDIRASFVSAKALELALEAGHPPRVLQALFFYVMSNAQRDPRHPFFCEAVERARLLLEHVGGAREHARHAILRGTLKLFMGDIGDAVILLEDGQRLSWNASPPQTLDGGMGRVPLLAAYAYCGANVPRSLAVAEEWIAEAVARDDLNAGSWLRSTSTWTLLAADAPDRAEARLREAGRGEHAGNDLFASMTLLQTVAIRIYQDAAASWTWIEHEARPAFEQIVASLVPLTAGTFAMLRAHAAAAAWQAGVENGAVARAAIEASIDQLADGAVLAPGIAVLSAQLALLAGDRVRAADLFEQAARGWQAQGMVAYAACAQLRAAQARCDRDAVQRCHDVLVGLAIKNPERYANVFAGPAAR